MDSAPIYNLFYSTLSWTLIHKHGFGFVDGISHEIQIHNFQPLAGQINLNFSLPSKIQSTKYKTHHHHFSPIKVNILHPELSNLLMALNFLGYISKKAPVGLGLLLLLLLHMSPLDICQVYEFYFCRITGI